LREIDEFKFLIIAFSQNCSNDTKRNKEIFLKGLIPFELSKWANFQLTFRWESLQPGIGKREH